MIVDELNRTGRAGGKTAAADLPVLPKRRRVVLPMRDARRLASYGLNADTDAELLAEVATMAPAQQALALTTSKSAHLAVDTLSLMTPAQRRRFLHKHGHQLALDGKPFGEQKSRRPEGSVSSGNVTTWRAPTPGGGVLKWGKTARAGLDRIGSLNPFRHRGK